MISHSFKRPARTGRALLVIVATVALASCADPSPTPSSIIVSTPLRVSPTAPEFPATWTPTFTWTPLPPTQTPTQTRTPTITPTPDAKAVCEQFFVISTPHEGVQIPFDGLIAYAWQGAPSDAQIYLTLINQKTYEGILVRWAAEQAFNMTVDMLLLPDVGVYDWTLSVHYEDLGDFCSVSGWFERVELTTASLTATSEAATEEPEN